MERGRRLRPLAQPTEAAAGQGQVCPGRAEEPLRRFKSVMPIDHLNRIEGQKGESVMAKLHARPSNQYRYEHYDPRF